MDLKNKSGPLHLHVGLHVKNKLVCEKACQSVDQSECVIYKSAISKRKQTTALHQGWQWAFKPSLDRKMIKLLNFDNSFPPLRYSHYSS